MMYNLDGATADTNIDNPSRRGGMVQISRVRFYLHILLTVYDEMHSPIHKLYNDSLSAHAHKGKSGVGAEFACAYFVFNHATLDTRPQENHNQFSYTPNAVPYGQR